MNVATCFDCKKYVQCERIQRASLDGEIDLCPSCVMKSTKDTPRTSIELQCPGAKECVLLPGHSGSCAMDPRSAIEPGHYGGSDNPLEHVKVAIAKGWDKRAFVYQATKYIFRMGAKPGADEAEDLEKAIWMLTRELEQLRGLPLRTLRMEGEK